MENKQVYDKTDDILRFLLSEDEDFRKKFLLKIENDPELREDTLIMAAYLKAVNSGELTGENYDSQDIRRYLLDEDIDFDKKFLEILKSDPCMRKEVIEHFNRYKTRMEQKEEQLYQYCFPDIYEVEKQVQAQIEKKKKTYHMVMRILPIAASILLIIGFFIIPHYYSKSDTTSLLLVNLPDTSITNLLTDKELFFVSKVYDAEGLDEVTDMLKKDIQVKMRKPDDISGIKHSEKESVSNLDIMRYYLAIFYLKQNNKDNAIKVLERIVNGDKQSPIYPFAESLLKSIQRNKTSD